MTDRNWNTVENCWFHKRTFDRSARQWLFTFGFKIAGDLLGVVFVDQRTEVVSRVKRVAGFPIAKTREDAFHQRVFDCFVYDQPRTRRAVLAHIPERGVDDMLSYKVEVPERLS